jgi:hypothetical protein
MNLKTFTIMFALLTLVSCGKDTKTVYVQGIQGPSGADGQSCSAERVAGGVNVTCGDEVSFVSDGEQGETGEQGEQGEAGNDGDIPDLSFVEVCPNIRPNEATNGLIETLVKLDGVYLAYFASNQANNQRLVKLPEGPEYVTTDGRRNVRFKIQDSEIVCL